MRTAFSTLALFALAALAVANPNPTPDFDDVHLVRDGGHLDREVVHHETGHGSHHHHHHLQRRQAQAIVPIAGISWTVGGSAVHKTHHNERILHYILDQVAALEPEVKELEAHAPQPRLQRRIVGTITGAVAISRSKKIRQQLAALEKQTHSLRERVDRLMVLESVAKASMPQEETEKERKLRKKDEKKQLKAEKKQLKADKKADKKHHGHHDKEAAHHLERRQAGIIVAPIGMHKARKDRKALEAEADFVAQLRWDVERVKFAQLQRLGRRGGRPAGRPAGRSGFTSARGSAAGRGTVSTAQGERVLARVRITTSSDAKHIVEQE